MFCLLKGIEWRKPRRRKKRRLPTKIENVMIPQEIPKPAGSDSITTTVAELQKEQMWFGTVNGGGSPPLISRPEQSQGLLYKRPVTH